MKRIVYTNIDTSESAPSNQGELLRIFDRSWRLRGWKTRMLLPGERAPGGTIIVPVTWINYSQRKFDLSPPVSGFGKPGWLDAPVVIFPDDVIEQQILECGRSLA